MNISDSEHEQNLKEMHRLIGIGYEFEVTSDGYTARHRGVWIGGAGVREKGRKRPWQHMKADRREYLKCAIRDAQQHERKS